jgi:hypothetical protein
MGEAEEVERGALRIRVAYAPRPMKAKVDEVRLGGVKRQPVPSTSMTRLASSRFSNAITLSSAYRTRMLFPLRRTRTSRLNHSSSTWCR